MADSAKDVGLSVEELRKLLQPNNPVAKAMWETTLEITRRYTIAEETVIVAFAARHGIYLPSTTGVRRRIEAYKKMELVHANISQGPGIRSGRQVIQESWCVDRRNGYEGFEKTWPRARLTLLEDGKMVVEVVDDPEIKDGKRANR